MAGASDAHGHDDVAIAVLFIGERADLPRGLFVLELDADGAVGRGAQKIEQRLSVKADGDGLAFVFLFDGLAGLAIFRARGGELHALLIHGKLHGMRALVGELRDAAHSVIELTRSRTTVL